MADAQRARRARGRVVSPAALALAGLLGVLATTSAHAQAPPPCDPAYGCEPGTIDSVPPQTCTTSAGTVAVGDRVTATASNVPSGVTVRFVLGGRGCVLATAGGEGSTGGEDGYFKVTVNFAVPQLPPGTYELTVEGPGYAAQCSGSITVSDVGVLGASETRSSDSTGGGGGSLARTGMAILALVVLAIALIVMGRCSESAQERRRRGTPRGVPAAS